MDARSASGRTPRPTDFTQSDLVELKIQDKLGLQKVLEIRAVLVKGKVDLTLTGENRSFVAHRKAALWLPQPLSHRSGLSSTSLSRVESTPMTP